jgi:hypothetical protein
MEAASEEPPRDGAPGDRPLRFNVLIPLLDFGKHEGADWYEFLSPDLRLLGKWVSDQAEGGARLERLVVEVKNPPGSSEPVWRDRFEIQGYLGWAGNEAPLFERMTVGTSYALEFEEDRLTAVRRLVSLESTEVGEAGLDLTYALFGYRGTKLEILQALELVESAAQGRAKESAACCNETVAPLRTKQYSPSAVSFLCSSRLMAYAALITAAARLRKRDRPRG